MNSIGADVKIFHLDNPSTTISRVMSLDGVAKTVWNVIQLC
jgi:hypothetical protein